MPNKYFALLQHEAFKEDIMAIPHCWKSNVECAEEAFGHYSDQHDEAMNNPSTCMLLDGHEEPHEFISDGDITITFAARSI